MALVGRRCSTSCPTRRLHVISGCGHWTMIEKTADFLAVVEPFLATTSGKEWSPGFVPTTAPK